MKTPGCRWIIIFAQIPPDRAKNSLKFSGCAGGNIHPEHPRIIIPEEQRFAVAIVDDQKAPKVPV
jgi:hypothetical protein